VKTLASFTNNAINELQPRRDDDGAVSLAIHYHGPPMARIGRRHEVGQANAGVLLHDTRFIGGDPAERSVYVTRTSAKTAAS
jgi:hypothetical protein